MLKCDSRCFVFVISGCSSLDNYASCSQTRGHRTPSCWNMSLNHPDEEERQKFYYMGSTAIEVFPSRPEGPGFIGTKVIKKARLKYRMHCFLAACVVCAWQDLKLEKLKGSSFYAFRFELNWKPGHFQVQWKDNEGSGRDGWCRSCHEKKKTGWCTWEV